MMTCGCDRVNGIWFPCAEHSIENENKRLKLQIDIMKKDGEGDARQIHGLQATIENVRKAHDATCRQAATLETERDNALRLIDELSRMCRALLGRCANCGGKGRVKILDYEDACGVCTDDRKRLEVLSTSEKRNHDPNWRGDCIKCGVKVPYPHNLCERHG